MTQAELATRADTAQPAIVRWESDRTAVSLDDVVRLVRLCGFDIEFRPSGTEGYRDLRRVVVVADLYNVTVEVASRADVIRSKQAATRPNDQRMLPTLREMLPRRGQSD